MRTQSTMRVIYGPPVRDISSHPHGCPSTLQTSYPYDMEYAIGLMERGVAILELERLKRLFRQRC